MQELSLLRHECAKRIHGHSHCCGSGMGLLPGYYGRIMC